MAEEPEKPGTTFPFRLKRVAALPPPDRRRMTEPESATALTFLSFFLLKESLPSLKSRFLPFME